MSDRILGGRYRLEGEIGVGGMASVHRAQDSQLDRTVAVKILAPQFAGDPSFVDRFRREAQTAAKLTHPNIVGVYDNGAENGTNYIVMEYVEGRTLADFLSGGGRLSPMKSVEVAEAVAKALAYAHERGVVHRDIKPANIMVTRDGQVKVMDFGIARLTTSVETIAQTATVLGTAAYLSPEQAQGQRVDGRSDIYSLGCCLFELLTGVPPFTGESAMSVAMQHVQETPAAPSSKNADLTPQMDAVVMKALAKNPANRYQTADEFREDLEHLRRGEQVSATPLLAAGAETQVINRPRPGQPTAVLPPAEEESKRKWWVIALVVIGMLAVLGGGAWVLAQSVLNSNPAPKVTVPGVVGLSLEDAQQRIERAGLIVAQPIQFREDTGERPDTVLEQSPKADERVEKGAEVTLTVATGPGRQEVPGVTGQSESQAQGTLSGAPYNFVVSIRREYSSSVNSGFATRTDPPEGTNLKPGSAITLFISRGESPSPTPADVAVPDVVCRSINSATNQIEHAGLVANVSSNSVSNPSCANANKVAQQNPTAGTVVREGSTVTITPSEPTSTSTGGP